MDFLYDHLSYLPEAMQGHVAGLIIILIGYFLSKIFAVLAVYFIPENIFPRRVVEEDSVSLRKHVSKICFWLSWVAFIFIGLKQVHPSLFVSSEFSTKSIDYLKLFTIVLGAFVILLSETYIARFLEFLRDILKSLPVSKDNFIFRKIMQFAWIPFFAIFFIALASTDTLGNKVAMSMFLLFLGWLTSNVVKQTIKSFIEPFGVKSELWPKFFSYFILVHFLIGAINLWR